MRRMWGLRGLRRLRVSESLEPNPRLWGLCCAETSRKRREGSRMFDALIESSHSPEKRRSRTVFVSLLIHSGVLAVIVVIPLIYYQGLPEYELLTGLAAQPNSLPPPRPPSLPAHPPPKMTGAVQTFRPDPEAFMTPTTIPDEILPPDENIPFLSQIGAGSTEGIPGGPPGGIQDGGPNWGFSGLGGNGLSRVPPPPPPPEPREPRRVSDGVQNARLIQKVDPVYPELAKRARISGIVLLQVTVNELGLVSGIKLIRGHPLLNQSAIDAVSQWKYSPTLLSGEPVPVIATVTVNFVLR